MILNVLTVGDVVGEQGLDFLTRHLRALQKLHDIHFSPGAYRRLLSAARFTVCV